MSEPVFTGSIDVTLLPSLPVFVTLDGNCPGCSAENDSKNGTARSAAFGCGVPGFAAIHCLTACGCVFVHSSTYFPCDGSALTHPWASELCASAHCATI